MRTRAQTAAGPPASHSCQTAVPATAPHRIPVAVPQLECCFCRQADSAPVAYSSCLYPSRDHTIACPAAPFQALGMTQWIGLRQLRLWHPLMSGFYRGMELPPQETLPHHIHARPHFSLYASTESNTDLAAPNLSSEDKVNKCNFMLCQQGRVDDCSQRHT